MIQYEKRLTEFELSTILKYIYSYYNIYNDLIFIFIILNRISMMMMMKTKNILYFK
jgi:hypothetical protein